MPVNTYTLEKAFHCLDQKAHKYEQKELANRHMKGVIFGACSPYSIFYNQNCASFTSLYSK